MELTVDNIAIWAYDEGLYFAEQREELLLRKPEFIATLIEFASKEDCPKKEQIQSILESYIQWCFLYNKTEELALINAKIQTTKAFLITQWLVLWFVNFEYIYGIYKQPQRLTDAACDKIAQDLLIGNYQERKLELFDPLKDGAREYAAVSNLSKLYFYINPADGKWKIAKYGRLFKFED